MLGADDHVRVRPSGTRRDRRHRPHRRSVLEMSVQAGRQPEQLREPVERHLLQLLQQRRCAPEDPDLVQPRGEQLGEDPRFRPGVREIGEEARALPVRRSREQDLVESRGSPANGSAVWRRRRQPRAKFARLGPGRAPAARLRARGTTRPSRRPPRRRRGSSLCAASRSPPTSACSGSAPSSARRGAPARRRARRSGALSSSARRSRSSGEAASPASRRSRRGGRAGRAAS